MGECRSTVAHPYGQFPPTTVQQGDRVLFQGRIDRSEAVIARTLAERGDPKMIFVAEVAFAVAVAVAAVGIEVKPTAAP